MSTMGKNLFQLEMLKNERKQHKLHAIHAEKKNANQLL
jgi:hypothetical protein